MHAQPAFKCFGFAVGLTAFVAGAILTGGKCLAEPPSPASLPSWRQPVDKPPTAVTRTVGTYAQRYGLYNYRRNWYAMPYRYRGSYYRPWYTLPPSYFVVPKNYSPYAPPTWSLPWPYGDYPSQEPIPFDAWAGPGEVGPGPLDIWEAPPADNFEQIAPPRPSGRYYW